MAKAKTPNRPSIRAVVYGPWATGKSHLLATFGRAYLEGNVAGPLLVSMFDPRGKDSVYLDPASYGVDRKAFTLVEDHFTVGQTARGDELFIPYTEVYIAEKLVTRVEYMHEEGLDFDDDGVKVSGWTVVPKYRKRLNRLFRDEMMEWGTYGFDSATSAGLMFRKYHQFVQNASSREPRQWYGGETDELEMLLAIRFASWRNNLVVICHTDSDKVSVEGGSVVSRYTPRLRGRMAGDIGTYYSEIYHSFADVDENGESVYGLQTRPDKLYSAASNTLGAPNPCENNYDALWTNWR